MPHTLTAISTSELPYAKLDPRLAALLGLEDRVFEPADSAPPPPPVPPPDSISGNESLRRGVRREPAVQRRSGPLAFLTAPRRWAGTFEPVRAASEAVRGGGGPSSGGYEGAVFSVVAVFVTAVSGEALDAIAAEHGIAWRCRAGKVATAHIDARQLCRLEEDARVVAVEWTGGAKPLGFAERRRGVSPRAAVGLATSAREEGGAGVVIGIVDIEGIDIYHPDFVAPDGRHRVIALWDQEAKPGPQGAPSPCRYGVVYTAMDVFMELDPNNRERGSIVAHEPLKLSHGTMVAGVAAGGGIDDPEMRGVAPGADVVFVSTRASGAGALAAMTEIAEAVDFVFREAKGRPCVVNLSLGDDLGPRDGTSPVERFLDEILREQPGRAVVVAAGNEQEAATHTSGALSGAGEATTLVCHAPRPSARHAVIEIWYGGVRDGEEGIRLQIESPDGAAVTPPIAPDGRPRAFDMGETRLVVASVKRYPGNGDAMIRVEMFPRTATGTMDTGEYRLHLTGDGPERTFHAWLDHTSFRLRADPRGAPVPPISLTSPATCESAVTAGACHHETGLVASFASRGPDRRGADKPEVNACGVTLRAPAAATTARYYYTFTGTSAAAPLITGAIALAFEHAKARGKRLSVAETKAFVRAAARGEARRLLLPPDGRLDELFAAAGIDLAAEGAGQSKEAISKRAPGSPETPVKKEGETMTMQETRTNRNDQDLVREKDGKQIGIGYYTLIQNGMQTGRLLVVRESENSDVMVEHWELFHSFRQPSWALTSQGITFEYVGEPISLATYTGAIARNSTYIVARCQQVNL